MSPVAGKTHDPSLTVALKRAVSNPAFLVAFVVLMTAALTLNAATQFLRLYFKKEPVPLARQLETIPPTLGHWVQVSKDQQLDPEMLDVLGTKQYIFRQYLDSRQVSPQEIAELNNKTDKEYAAQLGRIQLQHPDAVVRAAVTYYTGMVDTVAHIPDRCYVADGFVPESRETPVWTLADKNHQPIDVRVSSIHFEDATPARGTVNKNVAYFFHCNGEYEHDPIRGVRIRLQNLAERHAYYAKIEVMTEIADRQKSDEVLQDFLRCALPEVERCLPDWNKLKASGSVTPTASDAATHR